MFAVARIDLFAKSIHGQLDGWNECAEPAAIPSNDSADILRWLVSVLWYIPLL
jgi:hypothetical protein